jgi:RNA polymerase sigma factor (sigma-70 family)
MRNDADFAAYMAARWPFLVRTLVLIGSPRDEAEDIVQTGLARCYASWDRVRKGGDDVDAYVYRTVLHCWHQSRKRRWWRQAPGQILPEPPVADPTDQVLLRHALEAQLAGLAVEHREALVLRFVAGLDEPQVADVLDVPLGTVKRRVSQALGQVDLAALREMTG